MGILRDSTKGITPTEFLRDCEEGIIENLGNSRDSKRGKDSTIELRETLGIPIGS